MERWDMEMLLSLCSWLGEGTDLRPVSLGFFPYMHFMLALAVCHALQERQAAQEDHCDFPRKILLEVGDGGVTA